jgi:hypothetical protein
MSRKCLAIGVSSVEPVDGGADEFPYLDGAVVAAETIGQWALHSGFAASDVMVLTDNGKDRVIEATLQNAFDRLVPKGVMVDHFVLAFTGHGLTGINDDITYWLLSDSLDQGYSIFVEDLRRQLYAYGIQHLTIFSDACRAIAKSRDLHDLRPRPGALKRHLPPADIEIARFNACQDTTSAFMVKEPGAAAPGKCIFSGVVAEALWGRVPAAFDGAIIDSSSLGRGLRAAAKERATQYNLSLVPGGSAFFDKVIYFDQASPPLPPDPELQPWPRPDPSQVASAGAPAPGAQPGVFKSALENVAARAAMLGASLSLTHPFAIPSLTLDGNVSQTRRRLASPNLPKPRKQQLSERLADLLKAGDTLAASGARRKKAKGWRGVLNLGARSTGFEEAQIVVNRPVRQVWSEQKLRLVVHDGEQIAFAPADLTQEGVLMVEFADGLFAPVWFYRDLVGVVVRDDEGVVSIGYRSIYGGADQTSLTSTVISRLLTGDLSVDKVDELATKLRYEKHVNPVFGAIAAYCYDVTGDLNSIRRMAAYYGQRDQAAPYDIVFLGMIENDGTNARVPDVPRDPRLRKGKPPVWLTDPTDARDVRIAGRCPWLRQGWDFLSSPEDAELPLADGLGRFRASLTASVFTTLHKDGGEALTKKWRLKPGL